MEEEYEYFSICPHVALSTSTYQQSRLFVTIITTYYSLWNRWLLWIILFSFQIILLDLPHSSKNIQNYKGKKVNRILEAENNIFWYIFNYFLGFLCILILFLLWIPQTNVFKQNKYLMMQVILGFLFWVGRKVLLPGWLV